VSHSEEQKEKGATKEEKKREESIQEGTAQKEANQER